MFFLSFMNPACSRRSSVLSPAAVSPPPDAFLLMIKDFASNEKSFSYFLQKNGGGGKLAVRIRLIPDGQSRLAVTTRPQEPFCARVCTPKNHPESKKVREGLAYSHF
jgi:hypothetical protein